MALAVFSIRYFTQKEGRPRPASRGTCSSLNHFSSVEKQDCLLFACMSLNRGLMLRWKWQKAGWTKEGQQTQTQSVSTLWHSPAVWKYMDFSKKWCYQLCAGGDRWVLQVSQLQWVQESQHLPLWRRALTTLDEKDCLLPQSLKRTGEERALWIQCYRLKQSNCPCFPRTEWLNRKVKVVENYLSIYRAVHSCSVQGQSPESLAMSPWIMKDMSLAPLDQQAGQEMEASNRFAEGGEKSLLPGTCCSLRHGSKK